MKKHTGLYVVIITLLVSLTAAVFYPGVSAQADTATLELTVYKVEVIDEVATITGFAASVRVDLYDNLGQTLIDNGVTGSDGKVTFNLDERYPLSSIGIFHTFVKVAGMSQGEFTCQQGQPCQADVFSIDGLDPDQNDGILIVKVTRSNDLVTPVEGVQVNVWPADVNNVEIPQPRIIDGNGKMVDYNGVQCISNTEGYCVVLLKQLFLWEENYAQILVTNTLVKFSGETSADASYNWVPEGGLLIIPAAVDEKGKLDDCVYMRIPISGILSSSCKEKVKQTATAQATMTVDPSDNDGMNNAILQARSLSQETNDLFAAHKPDQDKIAAFLPEAKELSTDPTTQVKIYLDVTQISNNGEIAFFDGPAVGNIVEITAPDNPDILLGACQVNRLGECISIIDRNKLLAADGYLKFRILADGNDNGIFICMDGSPCEQHTYTVSGFTGAKDAMALFKVFSAKDYSLPIPDIQIVAGKSTQNANCINGNSCTFHTLNAGMCVTNEDGVCAIYANNDDFSWGTDDLGDFVRLAASINGGGHQDANNPDPYDNQFKIYYIALDKLGKVIDCTFTSPLNLRYPLSTWFDSPSCFAKEKVLKTAIAGYTATPTVTVTPTVTLTPTVTATPLPSATPTATLSPTPTPQPGLFAGESAPLAIGGIALLIVLLGGGAWVILRTRNKRS
jgi:hypothetical protein